MANIKLNKKIFEKEIGKLDEKMQEGIAMMGTPVDKVADEEIEVEIFPNRPDLLSYQGFKRSFLAFLGKKPGLKEYKINKPQKDYKLIVDSTVKEVRPYTACAIIKNLKFDDKKIKEMIDIQEKLHVTMGRNRKKLAIGIYPLEKITLPIIYKALEPDKISFIPLEMDREMNGLQILQRHPAGRDYAHLLAGKAKFPIFIDAKNQILSMPPIINSQITGKVSETTKDIFLECSGFDLDTLKKCLNIIVTTFADMGGEIYQMEIQYGLTKKEITPNLNPEKMKISLENANKLIGLKLNEKELQKNLEKMGHKYDSKTKTVESPAWRVDIMHEVDLIEDVAIAYGYENLFPEIPSISTTGKEAKKEMIKRKISEILAGLGLLEVLNYHLTIKNDQYDKMSLSEKDKKESIDVENSKTEYTTLRENLSHYILKNLSENVDAEYPQKIFEVGTTFELDQKKDIQEKEKLAIALTPGNFTELKQVAEYLFRMIEKDYKIVEPKETHKKTGHFIDGRIGEIKINDKTVGYLGEVHPKILQHWKIRMPVAIFEIDLEEIFKD